MRCHLGGGDNVWRAFRWQPCGTSSFSVLKSPPVLQVLFSTHSWWLLKNKSKNLSFIFYLSYHWLKEIMRVVLFLLYLRFTNILKPIISPHSMFASMQHYWGVELQKWSILASLVCCSLLLPRQIEQINRIRDREETNLGFICFKFFFPWVSMLCCWFPVRNRKENLSSISDFCTSDFNNWWSIIAQSGCSLCPTGFPGGALVSLER